MTIGSWNPETQQTEVAANIDTAALQRFMALAESGELDNLGERLDEQDQARHAMMLASAEQWEQAVSDLSLEQLVGLIRFFTVVEMQLENWGAGQDSPVIKLNKIIRQRGGKLDKEVLQWIRQNSNNRYIPNGAVM